jgi:hypothetical protein
LKKKTRRDDPLLRYLHHARNCDEHGIERVIKNFHDTGPIWGHQPKFGERIPVIIHELDPVSNEPIGEGVAGFYSGSTIKLVCVRDRGVYYDPPQTHLFERVEHNEEPFDVGSLGLAYLISLVGEAEARIAPLIQNEEP